MMFNCADSNIIISGHQEWPASLTLIHLDLLCFRFCCPNGEYQCKWFTQLYVKYITVFAMRNYNPQYALK